MLYSAIPLLLNISQQNALYNIKVTHTFMSKFSQYWELAGSIVYLNIKVWTCKCPTAHLSFSLVPAVKKEYMVHISSYYNVEGLVS